VIKHSAASPKLLQHTGRAVVFESVEDMTLRVDDPLLDVNADDVLVLRNAGPKGAPGMPEAGYLPIPKKLARGGVKDMVRISDARMSGTAFGTIVLHITPESAVGGPLALVRNGDMIRLDVAKRSIDLLVDARELEKRRAALALPAPPEWAKRGYAHLFRDHPAGRRRLRFRLYAGQGEGVVSPGAISPSLRGANGSRECAPDDGLRDEAIQLVRGPMDCFASLAVTAIGVPRDPISQSRSALCFVDFRTTPMG
jgi:hypothetical protein